MKHNKIRPAKIAQNTYKNQPNIRYFHALSPAIRGVLLCTLAVLFFASQAMAQPPKTRSTSITTSNTQPRIKPQFPIPHDPNQLMYLQRSMNSNTIVYAARFLPDGTLDPRNPVNVYWRRFNDSGETKALGYVERQFAFGVHVKKTTTPDTYTIEFKALPGRKLTLRQTGPHAVTLTGKIGHYLVRPIYLFVDLDQSGLLPKVIGISLYGRDIKTGKFITERITVSGGEIHQ